VTAARGELPTSASAQAGGLELAVAVDGALLRVALTNRSDGPVSAYFAAEGPSGTHHDFLTVALATAGAERTLRFTGDRNASTTGLARLAPGDTVADALDLHAWARDPINGATRLAPGDYALTATYRVDQTGVWAGALSAGPIGLRVV
jgi:hypothetical protein